METKEMLLIALSIIIAACIICAGAVYIAGSHENDDAETDSSDNIDSSANKSTVNIVETEANNEVSDSSPKSITIDVPTTAPFEKSASLGNYIVKVSKDIGVEGAFSVIVIDPNGGYLNPNSYSTKLYYSNGGGWQWNGWDEYNKGGFSYHRYSVFDAKVSKVMVQLNV